MYDTDLLDQKKELLWISGGCKKRTLLCFIKSACCTKYEWCNLLSYLLVQCSDKQTKTDSKFCAEGCNCNLSVYYRQHFWEKNMQLKCYHKTCIFCLRIVWGVLILYMWVLLGWLFIKIEVTVVENRKSVSTRSLVFALTYF